MNEASFGMLSNSVNGALGGQLPSSLVTVVAKTTANSITCYIVSSPIYLNRLID